jgi:saccharopine dehydrogenase-like NADP-dependent oxidoreductase
MKEIVVVGAGKIGATIADLLAQTADYAVTVVDRSQVQLDALDTSSDVKTQVLDITDAKALEAVLSGKFAVLSAAPFHLTTLIAEAAAKTSVHYLDLTEDVASTKRVMELSKNSKTAFIPQCGLAPIKPNAMAIQRRGPTRSPNKNGDTAAT